MDNLTEVVTEGVVDGGAPLGAGTPGGGVPPPAPTATAAPTNVPASPHDPQKVVSIPTSAMKRIKDEERERGRREALADLASRSGFTSDIELVSALATLRGAPQQTQTTAPTQTQPTTPPAPTVPGVDPVAQRNEQRAQAKYERDLEKLTRERDSFVQKYTATNAELKRMKEQLDAKEAEVALREIAVASGVTDVDYALRLFYREVENKSEEELAKMDEKTYFQSLRASKPYLFGEVVKPANTGPGVGGAPTAPKPGQVTTQTATNGQFDARKASPQDVQERLRKMGLNPHM